jgi:hypothetical protein
MYYIYNKWFKCKNDSQKFKYKSIDRKLTLILFWTKDKQILDQKNVEKKCCERKSSH